ncbi:MAG: alpha/beta hydrolase [Myxococcota bacterium]|jgi:pimeloyl-ACP methyl ester carboxylesterase|nr:alpha/beta hydrolase [Myxococcota bacterium]
MTQDVSIKEPKTTRLVDATGQPASAPGPIASPPLQWGSTGLRLHLAHANGFPPGTYTRLAEELARSWRVVAWPSRPLWPGSDPARLRGWDELATDLAQALRPGDPQPGIGVGHSLGAVLSLLAAVADPGLFRALVLIDPVIFTGWRARLWRALKRLGWGGRLPLVQGARRRRETWPSRAEARAHYGQRPLFASWDPRCLDDYLHHGLVETPEGVLRLAYPREWEAQVFATTPDDLWGPLRRLSLPLLVLRGETSTAFTREAARRLARTLPAARVEEVPGTGHLLPMEQPAEVARRITAFVASLG